MDSVSDQRPDRLTTAPLVMKWSVFFAAAGVVAYLCLLILRPFFGVVAWSAVLAITCYPFYQWLVRRNGRDALSAAITSALLVLAVVVPLAMIQGILCGSMFWLLGVPAAALWALVTVFASVVPFVGAAGVWVPGTVYLLAVGAWQKAIVLAVWGAAVVSSVDNFLRPRLVAGRVRLSGLAMFVAMLGGLQALGALGIILGPVLFATATAILDVLRDTPASGSAPESMPVTLPPACRGPRLRPGLNGVRRLPSSRS
jgi:predicted PurR-regulated permease PerM